MGKRASNGSGLQPRRRADGRYEGRVSVNGQVRSVYAKTAAECRKKMTSIQSDLDRGIYQAPSKITVDEWLNEWLTTFCKSLKPYTRASYQGIIRNHIAKSIGSLKLQSVRATHVQRLFNEMEDDGLSPKTIKNVSAILHRAFGIALKQSMIATNPCDCTVIPKLTRHEVKSLEGDEIPRFLEAIRGHRFESAYAVALFTGLRQGETLGLSWDQVDFEKGEITVDQQLQRDRTDGQYVIGHTTKNNQSRTIQPPSICFEYLKRQRQAQAQSRLLAGNLWNNPDNLVFTDELGGHLKIFTHYSCLKKIAAGIGRPDLRVHDLRHTAATVAIASGGSVKSVQTMMGHATASFTMDVYTHSSRKMMEDTANRVQNFYDTLLEQC